MNITKVLPIPLIRKNFTRSELFGILGAYDKDSKFCIEHTSSIKFFEQTRRRNYLEYCLGDALFHHFILLQQYEFIF